MNGGHAWLFQRVDWYTVTNAGLPDGTLRFSALGGVSAIHAAVEYGW
jgi:hypothetical protein